MRLLLQLCPSAASAVLQKVCDFEGLFASVVKLSAREVPTNLFHMVAELLSEARLHFQMALEAGKLPVAGLPSRCRGPGACSEPSLRAVAPFNSSLYRLVGNLSSKRSLNLSFDEAAKSSCWPKNY